MKECVKVIFNEDEWQWLVDHMATLNDESEIAQKAECALMDGTVCDRTGNDL